jgi:DNA-binding transcriptional LysR family regulator
MPGQANHILPQEIERDSEQNDILHQEGHVARLRAKAPGGNVPAKEGKGNDLVIDSLLEEPMVVALLNAHALAQNDGDDAALSLKDLAGETFIVYARQHGPGLYDATTAACLKAGLSRRLGQEAPRITSALSLVAAGLGISVVPAYMQRMMMDGVAYRRLKGPNQPKAVLNPRIAPPRPVSGGS